MITEGFTTSYVVSKSPREVFDAITNVRGWWSEAIEGRTDHIGDAFFFRHTAIHRCTQVITELVPDERVVWRVLDSHLNFTAVADEWTGTHFMFDISTGEGGTEVRFTHVGLTPEIECFEGCAGGWTWFVVTSLRELIDTGVGRPITIEEEAAHASGVAVRNSH